MQQLVGYLLDTNIFNGLLDGDIAIEALPPGEYFYSLLQQTELMRNSGEGRRRQLLDTFKAVTAVKNAKESKAASTPWGSPWGSPWDQGGEFYPHILAELESAPKRGRKSRGNQYDALTIEICKYGRICFVTSDEEAAKAAQKFDVVACCFSLPAKS